MSNTYIVYLHGFKTDADGNVTADETGNPDGYGVYVVNDADLDDMPEEREFDTLEEAEKFADELAEKYDTYIERYAMPN